MPNIGSNEEYHIQYIWQRLWRKALKSYRWLIVSPIIAGYTIYYYSPLKEYLGNGVSLFILMFVAGLALLMCSISLLGQITDDMTGRDGIWAQIKQIWFQRILLKSGLSHVEKARILNTYHNVRGHLLKPLGDDPFESRPKLRLLRKLIKLYKGFDRLESVELKQRLEAAGVFNVGNDWYNKGKTIEEALMLAVYTAKLSSDETKHQATEKEVELARDHAAMTAELHSRKQREQVREAVEKELDRYTRGTTSTTASLPLSIFSGEYEIAHSEQKAVAVMLRLDEAGEFEIYRRNGKSRQHLMTVRSGETASIELSPPAESGRLEIVMMADGEFDTISLP